MLTDLEIMKKTCMDLELEKKQVGLEKEDRMDLELERGNMNSTYTSMSLIVLRLESVAFSMESGKESHTLLELVKENQTILEEETELHIISHVLNCSTKILREACLHSYHAVLDIIDYVKDY